MEKKVIGFLSDLNIKDDAVGLCKGLVLSHNINSTIIDISHNVTPFDIEEGGMYLADVPSHFPRESIMICVVFPETGTTLDSIVVRNEKDQFFVAPNNGLLTRALMNCSAKEAYRITKIELPDAMNSSFYGRDLLVKGAALLSAGKTMEDLGEKIANSEIVMLQQEEAKVIGSSSMIEARIDIIDKNFGNIWTNVDFAKINELGIKDGHVLSVNSSDLNEKIELPFLKSFGFTEKGKSLAYINSRGKVAFGINQGNFAEKYKIKRGEAISISYNVEH